jgi:hypothetical protein
MDSHTIRDIKHFSFHFTVHGYSPDFIVGHLNKQKF